VRMDSEEEEASYGQDSYDPSEAYEIIDDDFEQDSDSKSTSESEGSDVAARVVELPAASPRSPITPPQQAAVEEALNGGAPAVMEKVAPEESSKAAAPAVMEMVAPEESSALAPAQAPEESSALAVVEGKQALALTEEATKAAQDLDTETEEKLQEIFRMASRGDDSITRADLIITLKTKPEVSEFFGLPPRIRQEDGSRDAMEKFFQGIDENDDRLLSWPEIKIFYCKCKKAGEEEAKAIGDAPSALTNETSTNEASTNA